MRKRLTLCMATFWLAGCGLPHTKEAIYPDGGTDNDMNGCLPRTDMAPPAACKASNGLAGVPLVCVDFDQVPSLMDPKVAGWNFSAIVAGNCPSWESSGGVLQIQNFGSFGGSGTNACGFTLPQTTAAQISQYQRLTLSIQQRIELLDPAQQAQIFLNSDTPANRVMWQGTGTRAVARQQTMITVNTADLPDRNGFFWLFKISAQLQAGVKGWQFDSIAIIGN